MTVETLVHAWIDSSKIIIVILVKIPVTEKKVKHSYKKISRRNLNFQGISTTKTCLWTFPGLSFSKVLS